VERGHKVYVHRLDANEGADLEFDNVLLVDNDGKISVGSPKVEGTKVAATVVEHLRGDKVLVFKKKRRKTYQKLNGHRQDLTQILIQGILVGGASVTDKLTAKKQGEKPSLKKKVEVEAEAIEEIKAAPVKKATVKKAAPKKAAAKKSK
jgi:large subunit ribosomal protein L21